MQAYIGCRGFWLGLIELVQPNAMVTNPACGANYTFTLLYRILQQDVSHVMSFMYCESVCTHSVSELNLLSGIERRRTLPREVN